MIFNQFNAFHFSPQDVDLDFNLTDEEKIDLCLKVPCRVELGRSNVCTGVERGWPKRIFKKDTFEELRPKEKQSIYRLMEKKAVHLDSRYVNDERLKERVRRRTTNALAPFWEERYLKHRYLRIKALGETQRDVEKHIETVNDVDDYPVIDEPNAYEPGQSIHDFSQDSMITVINTQSNTPITESGNTKESAQSASDNNNNGNDDSEIEYMTNDENLNNLNNWVTNNRRSKRNVKSSPERSDLDERQPLKDKHTSVRVSSAIQEVVITSDSEQDVGDEEEIHDFDSSSSGEIDLESHFNYVMSESSTKSQYSEDTPTPNNSIPSTVQNDGFSDPTSILATPANINPLRNLRFPMLNEEDSDADYSFVGSLQFFTQEMTEVKTSTQKDVELSAVI